MRVACHLIFGDLPEPFLEAALRSVEWMDYVAAVNTAPGTAGAYANEATVRNVVPPNRLRIADYKPDGQFSFADARNLALDMVDDADAFVIVDADDVHLPEFERHVRFHLAHGYDEIAAHFWHVMRYRDIVQGDHHRRIVFKRHGSRFRSTVHEGIETLTERPVTLDGYHYLHYGYLKDPADILERWRRYAELEGDPYRYLDVRAEHLLDDRLPHCTGLPVEHPEVARAVVETFPACPAGALERALEPRPRKAGLILLTFDDADLLDPCLWSLAATEGDFELYAIDIGSTDGSAGIVESYANRVAHQIDDVTVLREGYLSLARALNIGLDHFKDRPDVGYVGWVHPDMRFPQPSWLNALVDGLEANPKIGKLCAHNPRVPPPSGLIDAHEQCYLIPTDVIRYVGGFDERYVGIGGYEDWDHNRRILNYYDRRVCITPDARVEHIAMQTRRRRDTTEEQRINAGRYLEKWGDTDAPV